MVILEITFAALAEDLAASSADQLQRLLLDVFKGDIREFRSEILVLGAGLHATNMIASSATSASSNEAAKECLKYALFVVAHSLHGHRFPLELQGGLAHEALPLGRML